MTKRIPTHRSAAIWAIALVLAFVAAACGGDSGPSGPDVLNMAGTYDYAFNVSNASLQVSCSGTGRLTINQNGAQFSGQSTDGATNCTGPGGQLVLANNGQVTGGTINGNQISFSFPLAEAGCNATGTASGSPVNNLSGIVTCTLAVSGQTVQLSGTWQGSR